MVAEQLNIDDFVDYVSEYRQAIKVKAIQGDRILGKCPFHDDKKDSFTADAKTGKCHCFAGCIDGNFITFWAKLHNTDTKDAYKQILEKYGKLNEHEEKPKKPQLEPLTLSEYAFQKRLPEEFLKDVCRVETGKDRDGTSFLKVPYYDEGGLKAPVFRKRYGHKEFRWSYGSAGKLTLYGLWRLPSIRDTGSVILVEGESDTQTLWHLSFPALGVPGASNFKSPMIPPLDGLKVYIHVEPDKGGDTFLEKVCRTLHEGGFAGEVYTWSCKGYGAKDPSELFMNEGKDEAIAKIQKELRKAKKIDLDDITDIIPEAVKGAPVNLRQPEGWIYSEKGISHIDEKKVTPVMVCRTPIILTQRLKSLETGEEKIEIAFKRDGKWQTAIYPRSTVFTSRAITTLADLGCTITSENAKQVVKFLEALESENIDIITRADSTSTFGWQTRNRFLPGHADDVVLDIEPSLRGWAAAYHASGTAAEWTELMRPHRNRDKFRFILAAAFAAPLLRILSQRIFFVYNWGGSKGGKTAALKAALSVWGDPEHLMVNFNATQVALERMAGFYNDLPMGIDERQLAGNKQENIEKIVYMLASGTGRARGSKGGGLQQLNTWRTVCLATGEEPLSTETSQTGVSTRVLEIYGGPFTDEKEASRMHQMTAQHYGHAGTVFIDHIMETDERSITDEYNRMTEEIYKMANGTSGSHIAGIAAVALADVMIDSWIFGAPKPAEPEADNGKLKISYSNESWNRAVQMAETIIKEQLSSGLKDVNENATQFIVDWILSNSGQFGTRAIGTCLGTVDEDAGKVYIYPSLLNQALQKAGYSPRKTLKYLADNDIIASSTAQDGSKKYSVTKWFNNQTCRFVCFDIGRFTKRTDPLNEEEAAAAMNGGWRQVSDEDLDKLPFNDNPFTKDEKEPPKNDYKQEELPF